MDADRAVIDVTLLVDALEPNPGGIGRYTLELSQGLMQHPEVSARFFGRGRLIDDPLQLIRGDDLARVSRLRQRNQRRCTRSTLIHGPNFFLPYWADTGVITVHDLSVFRFPETHPAERVAAFEQEFSVSLRKAAHIITDTETVRQELIARYTVPANRITAIALGVDGQFRPGIHGPQAQSYALCVSTLEPRKKIGELLTAWRRLPRTLRDAHPLMLAGGAGWRNEALLEQIAVGVAEGWLKHLGFVAEADLPALYSGAALFLYPSIYEGFGLPPLEAMACGAPVMVSGSSCLPEVCGEAARYIDPDDPDGFVQSIEANLTDNAWRAGAALRGTAHAAGFDWATCIDRTVDVYRQVAAG